MPRAAATASAGSRRSRTGTWLRLAHALSPLFTSVEPLQAGLQRFEAAYAAADRDSIARKLGLAECRDEDVELIRDLHVLLRDAEVDMTLFFRALADVDPAAPGLEPMSRSVLRRGEAAGIGACLRCVAAAVWPAPARRHLVGTSAA